MEAPVFAQKFGNGKWVGIKYILDICPICGEQEVMMFTGDGKWGCSSCKRGGLDIKSFREFCEADDMLSQYVPYIVDPIKPEEVIVISEYKRQFHGVTVATGFGSLDALIGGLSDGALTVLTGKRGEGKSSWLGQMSLNAIDAGHKICFYSGELSAGRFQSWLFSQAAGARHMESKIDQFGATRWMVQLDAEKKIREWLGDQMVLYDNTKVKSSERNTIMRAFVKARQYYGCDLFIVDNLMTAQYDIETDKDSLRAQANFASELLNFARENSVHVVLVAHPRKGGYEDMDINESVAGLGEITNLATNVMQVRKTNDKERAAHNCDAIITVSKNREYGVTGALKFNFEPKSKRFVPLEGSCIAQYGWVKL